MSNVPTKFYVGIRTEEQDRYLGWMIVADADHTKAFEKQKDRVNNWCGRNNKIPSKIVENTPRTGFKIVTNVSRYSTSNVVWRVEHPEGFEFEITSTNFCDLVETNTLINGVFQEEMFFTKDRCLVSKNTKLYLKSIQLEDDEKNKKELEKELKYGDVINFRDSDYQFYGKLHIIYNNANNPNYIKTEKSVIRFVLQHISTGKFVFFTTIPTFTVGSSQNEIINKDDLVQIINKSLIENDRVYSYNVGKPLLVNNKSFKKSDIKLEYKTVDRVNNINSPLVYTTTIDDIDYKIVGICYKTSHETNNWYGDKIIIKMTAGTFYGQHISPYVKFVTDDKMDYSYLLYPVNFENDPLAEVIIDKVDNWNVPVSYQQDRRSIVVSSCDIKEIKVGSYIL